MARAPSAVVLSAVFVPKLTQLGAERGSGPRVGIDDEDTRDSME